MSCISDKQRNNANFLRSFKQNKHMKKFMIAAISAVLLTIALPSNAQKCRFSENKTDQITGEKIREMRVQVNNNLILWFCQKNSEYTFMANYGFVGKSEYIIPKGSKGFFKLENGTIIELTSIEKTSPSAFIYNGQVITNYTVKYALPKEELEKMSESGFTYVKINTIDSKSRDYEVKKGKPKS